jgi:SAM-dependent methyltransferase
MRGLPWALEAATRRRWQQHLNRLRRPAWLGTLRRATPLSGCYGYDRGRPIDRYYIERFLQQHNRDITGRVVEIKDSRYTDMFGGGVTLREVVDIDAANPQATVVADLATPGCLDSSSYDCCVIVQTLHLLPDPRPAIEVLWRALRPGGVLLATVPCIARVAPDNAPIDYWRWTPAIARRLIGEVFGEAWVDVQGHGNVLAAMAFLTGMAYQELSLRELDTNDSAFPMLVSIRAVKS